MADETKVEDQASETTETETLTIAEAQKLKRESQRLRAERTELKAKFEDAEKKAAEFDALMKKQAEEQGNFKGLYEEASKKLESVAAYEARIKAFESRMEAELEEVKKGMTEHQTALIEKLPASMTIEERVAWAKELMGSTPAKPAIETARPGGTVGSVEAALKEFDKADTAERTKILLTAKRQNAKLYEALLHK